MEVPRDFNRSIAKPGFRPVELLTERRGTAVAVAVALFAAIFVARATVGALGDAISFLYVVPVVLAATALGARAGLLAGVVAFALSSVGNLFLEVPTTAIGYVNRGVVYLFIGALTGRFATTLRALEAESARHFNLSLDMISTAGFDGRFKAVNPAFVRTLGYRAEDLIDRPFLDFVHPDDREKTEEEAASLADGRTTVQFQNRYLDSKGEVHWIEWTSVPLLDEHIIYAVARDVTDRKELEQELERLSQCDPLTELFNRRRFDEELERQLAYTRRYGKGGALLVLDLDRFKQINDDLGHAAGDEALCAVAEILRLNLRQSDTVARADAEDGIAARLGGDEFAVLLPEADEEDAQAVASRLLEMLAAADLTIGGRRVELAASIGIALFDEHGCPPAMDLLAVADRAMYLAKAAGGSNVALL
jgi:diguanylate cyclase (GGDEF)-like protein/PAS domain S-box-containing protein